MSSRLRTVLLALLASLATAAPATAAPRVGDIDAIAFQSGGRSDYVVFNVRASGASVVRLSWGRNGSSQQGVRNGQVGIGFARRGAKSFRIHVRACRRKRCSKVRRVRGSFRIVKRNTDPLPNSPVIPTPDPLEQFTGLLPPGLPVPELPVDVPLPKR